MMAGRMIKSHFNDGVHREVSISVKLIVAEERTARCNSAPGGEDNFIFYQSNDL
jgi:hypothetical protein